MTSTHFPRITLHPNRDFSVKSFHPWIFSGAIRDSSDSLEDGSTVEVYSASGEFLAIGHYSKENSIAVKILSSTPFQNEASFFEDAFKKSYSCRSALGLISNPLTTAFRFVNAEGDHLPGLIIDLYGETAVIQCQSVGMHRSLPLILNALQTVFGSSLKAVIDKSTLSQTEEEPSLNYLFGSTSNETISENGISFAIDLQGGQKTGFYLDQRENRKLLLSYSKDKTVLDAFSHTGAFATYALSGGAKSVCCVDASKKALQTLTKNISLNFEDASYHTVSADCFQYLESLDEKYDLIILDPPAFVKHKKGLKRGITGYEIVNYHALRQIAPGGVLFTFSCSQLISRETFQEALLAGAKKAKRQVSILHTLSQAPCHRVNLFHREGEYLKGFVLYVE